jgi:hypothetical protein
MINQGEGSKFDNWRKQAWLLKKSTFAKTTKICGIEKCLGKPGILARHPQKASSPKIG